MKYLLYGGPMDSMEMEVPDPPWPWLRVAVPEMVEIPTFEAFAASSPPTPHFIPIANYRRVRYVDGRIGYEYAGMDS